MATTQIMGSSLWLVFDGGLDEVTGKSIVKTKSFNNVKPTANAEQLYTIAQAIAGLQQLPLHSVERKDTSAIEPV